MEETNTTAGASPRDLGSENADPSIRRDDYANLDVNGAKLAYRDLGHGDPIILVHANISDIRSWQSIEKKLAERFRVIVYSRRYAWPNESIADGVDDPWATHAEDLEALITKLDIAPVHVVGNSTGAYVALLLARRRPQLVRTLILEEPPAISILLPSPPSIIDVLKLLIWQPFSFLPTMMFGVFTILPTTTAFQKGDDEQAIQTFTRGILGNEFYSKVSPARLEQMRANVKPLRALFLNNNKGMPPFLEADAKAIVVPTILVTGEKTSAAQVLINRRLVSLIPKAEEAVIPEASHLMHEDNPDRVCEVISVFIDSHAA